jgi:antibiotic biosynthesis monooxygenase (ABM) superfamily enzyme
MRSIFVLMLSTLAFLFSDSLATLTLFLGLIAGQLTLFTLTLFFTFIAGQLLALFLLNITSHQYNSSLI